MPYARIHMAEWEDNDVMRKHYANMHQIVKKLFPEIIAFFQVETSETSSLVISVYKDEAAAERALEQRDDWHKDKPFKDIFSHAGLVGAHYVEQEQVDLWGQK